MAKLFKLALEQSTPVDPMYNVIDNDNIDLSKDRMAIEDTTDKLNDAIKMQADLTEQLEASEQIEVPTEEDVNNTEVAIESAIAKLGVSREEYGLHVRSTRSFSVSQEGIVEIIKQIGKTIMDLINKIIRFFKKLFNKIRLKLGNYKTKIQEMKEKLSQIGTNKSKALMDKDLCKAASEEIENLNLINCALYVKSAVTKTQDIPKFHLNSILVCNKLADWVSSCVDDALKSGDKDWQKSANEAIDSGNYNNVNLDNNSVHITTSKQAVFYLGGSGSDTYYIEIEYYPEGSNFPTINLYPHPVSLTDLVNGLIKNPIQVAKWVLFNSGLFKCLTDRVAEYKCTDYRNIVVDMENRANDIIKLVDEGPKVFDEIASIQKKLEDLSNRINKGASKVDDDDNLVAVKTSQLAKNIKVVAADISGAISKVYFSAIRDYLVIGNVLIKHFG